MMRVLGIIVVIVAAIGIWAHLSGPSHVVVASKYKQSSCNGVWFAKLNVCAEVSWLKRPVVGASNNMVVRLRGQSDIIRHARLEAQPWMPSMGHGVEEIPTITSVDKNFDGTTSTFEVSNVGFNMSGVWDVYLKVHDGKKQEEARFGLKLND